mmetsp:Transcript_22497/g.54413  ORF Transcript_22497/g.54413 Transcript_22497/m.54413 type:complete len:99 (+) Transcript_22497:453-749(+)
MRSSSTVICIFGPSLWPGNILRYLVICERVPHRETCHQKEAGQAICRPAGAELWEIRASDTCMPESMPAAPAYTTGIDLFGKSPSLNMEEMKLDRGPQ